MRNRHRRGFTLVELLVVIGVIALLVGILIPVVAKVRQTAYVANTKNLMQKIAAACTAYQLMFHSAPGAMPNQQYDLDYTSPTPGPVTASGNFNSAEQSTWKYFTQSEDLVVSLTGGLWKDLTKPNSTSFDSKYLGQGPTNFNPLNPGKSAAFIAADPSDLSPIPPTGTIKAAPELTLADPNNGLNQTFVKDSMVPEFMDKFPDPRPIIYVRANPGGLNGTASAAAQIISPAYNAAYHYNYRALAPYINYQDAGELLNQPPPVPNTTAGSDPMPTVKYFMSEQSSTTAKYAGTYILISAGLDRKFGTSDDLIMGGGGAN